MNANRAVWLALAILLAVGLALVASPERVFACSCVVPGSPSEELAESGAVFLGRPFSWKNIGEDDWGGEIVEVAFEVETIWKGPLSETIYVTTRANEASCGYTFSAHKYIVYTDERFRTWLCSRTRPLSEAAEDLAELGPGQAPVPGTASRATAEYADPASPEPELSATGGCGRSARTVDLPMAALLVGVAWCAVRRRH